MEVALQNFAFKWPMLARSVCSTAGGLLLSAASLLRSLRLKKIFEVLNPLAIRASNSELDREKTSNVKKLTFYCLSCRQNSALERLPVQCAHCGSLKGLIYRWRGIAWQPARAVSNA